MKPAPFEYRAPEAVEGALEALEQAGWDGKLLAGGQSLVPVMNFRLAQPRILIDVNRVADLDHVRVDEDGELRLGALVRQATLEHHPLVAAHAPLLAAAIPWIAHPQIRNRGTLGGSLAHADPAAELPAVMIALEARFRLARTSGDRWVGADDFFHGLFETELAPEEMLLEVAIPPQPERRRVAFQEVARRAGDYALVGLATTLELDGDRIGDLRLVYFSVGDRPVAVEAAGQARGCRPGIDLYDELAAAVASELQPSDDIHASAAYRRHVAGVLARRGIEAALAGRNRP